ncbi:MAG TPA: S8 family serine peptidase [Chitinophagaceae bacterium]|nr:S8 family serine peptidase [Chitinophagaceae bacterium]
MKPNPIPLMAVLLCLYLSPAAQVIPNQQGNDEKYRLFLQGGSFTPARDLTDERISLFNRTSYQVRGKSFVIIQFDQIPSLAEREQLKSSGIELLDYVPGFAYTATITGALHPTVLSTVHARAVVELTARQKMQPDLAKGIIPPWSVTVAGTVDVWISFPASFSFDFVKTELQGRNFDIVSDQYKRYRVIAVRLSTQRLDELASFPFIEYVEPSPHEPQLLNNKSRANSRTNILNASIPGGRNLQGQGVTIGIGDNADPLRHIDFTGRIINRAPIIGGNHGVHVEGTAAGAGNIEELYRGAAPRAMIIAQAFTGILTNAASYVQDHQMVITNNSYGNIVNDCVSFGSYSLYSRVMDQQAFELSHLEHVFAVGNSGGMSCSPYPAGFATALGDFQSAKNLLCVGNTSYLGAIQTSSSKGPTKDGRIKPEVTAQGLDVYSTFPTNTYGFSSGTSMASPAVAGGLALLYERYRALHSDSTPVNALMKALICNGATDLGNPGPDYSYGFGWLNMLRSVKMLEQNNIINDSVANAANKTHLITVPSNTAQLKVMLYWNDPAAALLSAHTLVNDLDLEVNYPSTPTYYPALLDTIPLHVNMNAGTGADHINNIEQVVINNPPAGTYTLTVKGTAVTQNPKQQYYIVYDTIPVSITLTYPSGGERLKPGEQVYISWDSAGNAANPLTLEWSDNNGSSWQLIDNNVSATARMYSWTVPSSITDEAKVRISRNSTALSSTGEKFVILGIPTVTFPTPQCEGYIYMDWSATAVSGATDYEVMMLQGNEMVSMGTTAATHFTISGLSKDTTYWVAVRARLNGNPGRRSTAISYQPNSGSCTGTMSDKDLKIDAILEPASNGRKHSSTEFSGAEIIKIRIKNLDDAATTGDVTVSYSLNGNPVSELITAPAIAGQDVLEHTFTTPANMAAAGTYELVVSVSQTGDLVSQNNSMTKIFKQLANDPITITELPFLDDFESADSQSYYGPQMGFEGRDRYDLVTSTVYGRGRTFLNSGIAYSGSRALTLDADRFVSSPGNIDSLTAMFNLATFDTLSDDIRLDFRFKNHGQQSNAANKVWVRGAEDKPWIQIYDLYANQNDPDGSYKLSSSIQLADSLKAHLQNFSSTLQVRWGQWGQILASDDLTGTGYTFDDIHLYKVTDDIEMVSIDTPIVSSCNLDAMTPVRITVRNNSNTSTSPNNVPVEYRVDGGSWISGSVPPIAANTAVQYEFVIKADLSAPGAHKVETRVLYGTDDYIDNDTLSVDLINSPIINSFPYLQDFESNNGSWYTGGKNSSWEYGTPNSTRINRAASGSKAWKTHSIGNYNDFEKSYLYSPCFDVSGMTNPTLSLSIALDLEDCGAGLCDGAYVEYSSDGVNWLRLGASGQGFNWYNKSYASNNLWSVQNYHRWHVATIPLPTGETQLRLRFVVSSDQSVNRDGIAIDDIHIYNNTAGIYDGVTMGSPVTQAVSGTNWINFLQSGKLIASVEPENNDMGNTAVQAYIYTGSVRNSADQYYHNRNITIQPEAGKESLSPAAKIRFYFRDSETENLLNASGCSICTKPTTAYELGVSKYSDPDNSKENGLITDDVSGTWVYIPPSSVKMVPFDIGYYAEFSVSSLSELWLNNGGVENYHPLPVQLIDFTARKQNNKDVLAAWSTSSEIEVNRFEIEMAKGNAAYQQNQYVKIGEVAAVGNSTTDQHYEFLDAEANKSGVRYYRLKMIDNNGSFTYSVIRPVVFDQHTRWQVYPNPSTGIFNLVYQLNAGEELTVKLYDITGRLAATYHPVTNGFLQKLNIDLDKAHFSPGLYLLDVSTPERKQLFKLLKQ